jgi:hypothetical protein
MSLLNSTLREVLLVLICSLCSLAHGDEALPDTRSTVELYADTDKAVQIGTGFFISDTGDVATAFHVLAGAKSLLIVSHVGSYTKFSIKAFDAERDLAVIKIDLPPGIKTPFLKTNSPPIALRGLAGYVIGNPDQKKDFTIHVTFPRDYPVLSQEWAVASHGSKSPYIFAKANVKLVALDGTLNHGMSGGPVIVNGIAVGVFSGGEEDSGGGLAWAISAEYLSNLEPAPAGVRLQDLPQLTLLSSESAKPQLQKAAQSSFGRDAFPSYVTVITDKTNLQAAADLAPQLHDGLISCKPYLDSLPDHQPVPAEGTSQDNCVALVLGTSNFLVFSSNEGSQVINNFSSTLNKLASMLEKRVAFDGTADIKQGHLRMIRDAGTACESAKPNLFAGYKREASVFFNDAVPLKNLPPFPPFGDKASTPSIQEQKRQVYEYLSGSSGKALVTTFITLTKSAERMDDALIEDLGAPFDCMQSFFRAVDFQADLTRIDDHVDAANLTPAEQAFFIGGFLSYFDTNVEMVTQCEAQVDSLQGGEEALFSFKRRHTLYLRNSDEIGTKAIGMADFEDLKKTTIQYVRDPIAKLVSGYKQKGVLLQFCQSVVKHLAERDIAHDWPDVAEAISGNQIERQKPDLKEQLEKVLGSAFTQSFIGSPSQAPSVVVNSTPALMRIVVRVWEGDLLSQCQYIATPLPERDASTIRTLSDENTATLKSEQKMVRKTLASATGPDLNLDGAWRSIEGQMDQVNLDLEQQFGIQTSGKLETTCVNLTRPDVQDKINQALAGIR